MHLELTQDNLILRLEGWEAVWAFKRRLSIPTANIRGASNGVPRAGWLDLRAPGSLIPCVLRAGTYHTKRGKEFWYVSRGKQGFLTIELDHSGHKRVVLSIGSAAGWAARINALVEERKRSKNQ